MRHRSCKKLPLVLGLAAALALPAFAEDHIAGIPDPQDVPYAPGTIRIDVDATNLTQRIFKVKETLPVVAGPLTLLYPEWVPGGHSPRNPIDKVAGITFTAGGKKLDWKRDPLNVFAFHLDVPAGVSSLTAEFVELTPTDPSQGRVAITPNMLSLEWISTILYPAGHYGRQVQFDPHVTYPSGWTAFTGLHETGKSGDTVNYETVPFDILVDSPVYAGKYTKQVDLSPAGAKVPVQLGIVADAPKYLEAKPEQIAQHKALYAQAMKLYGAQHYDHYQFLFSVSDQMGGNGLEHQRSSEDGTGADYFTAWDPKVGFSDLLAHEYTHSWNGKYRRPADLWVPNLNEPMQDSLLWVYEGQTQYWGNVLAARSGMRPLDASRDALAQVIAYYAEGATGLSWRAVQDTTNDPIIANRSPKPFRNYQLSEDYYQAGQMIWLEADALIRSKTAGKKSLDDFAHAFFGVNDGDWKNQDTYKFEDVVATLNSVYPYDWTTFLRERLDGKHGLVDGIGLAGWKLVFKDTPTAYAKALGSKRGGGDFVYSLGLSIGKDGKVGDVRWDSPAFKAGIGSGNQVTAVNGTEYSAEALNEAVKAAKADKNAKIVLTIKELNLYRDVSLDYHDGLKYPALERIDGKPDLLTPILTAKK